MQINIGDDVEISPNLTKYSEPIKGKVLEKLKNRVDWDKNNHKFMNIEIFLIDGIDGCKYDATIDDLTLDITI